MKSKNRDIMSPTFLSSTSQMKEYLENGNIRVELKEKAA